MGSVGAVVISMDVVAGAASSNVSWIVCVPSGRVLR